MVWRETSSPGNTRFRNRRCLKLLQENAAEIKRRTGRELPTLEHAALVQILNWKGKRGLTWHRSSTRRWCGCRGGIHPAYEVIMEAIKHGTWLQIKPYSLNMAMNYLKRQCRANCLWSSSSWRYSKVIREGLAANHIEWLAGIIQVTLFWLKCVRKVVHLMKRSSRTRLCRSRPNFWRCDAAHKLTILASCAFGIPPIKSIPKVSVKSLHKMWNRTWFPH